MRRFGLIGKTLKHTFSPKYFAQKFHDENINDATYGIFELNNIEKIKQVFEQAVAGLNVTIPYKEEVLPFMDKLTDAAAGIKAVNTIIFHQGMIIGHNTDVYGFTKSLKENLNRKDDQAALILGSGGASKAVQYALKQLHIPYKVVSRTKGDYSYDEIDQAVLQHSTIIVNTTPLGMYPQVDSCPDLAFDYIDNRHLIFDLVYNPAKTKLLLRAEQNGASVVNGYDMLVYQAEASWDAWNNPTEYI